MKKTNKLQQYYHLCKVRSLDMCRPLYMFIYFIITLLLSLNSGSCALLPRAYALKRNQILEAKELRTNIKGMRLVFPTYDECSWTPANYNNLRCPLGGQVYPGLDDPITLQLTLKRPHFRQTGSVLGYLCTKYRLTTTCESNWAAVEDVQHVTTLHTLPVTECLAAIKSRGDGVKHDFLEHPIKDCSWWKTKSVSQDHIIVEDHPVTVDLYSGSFIDPLFPGGRYAGSGTQTLVKSKVWVPASLDHPSTCDNFQSVSAILYLEEATTVTSEELLKNGKIWTDITREKRMSDACSMDFCYTSGIKFGDGEFFSWEKSENLDSRIIEMLKNVPDCAPDSVIKLQDPSDEGHFSATTNLAQIFLMKCHDTISKLRNSEPVSQVEISYLGQNYPGHGPAYKWTNGTLYKCPVSYITGSIIDDGQQIVIAHGGTINHLPSGYVYNDWTPTSDPKVFIGPNGMLNISGVIEVPFNTVFRDYIHEELTRETGFHDIIHPDLRPIIDTSPDEIEWVEHPDNDKSERGEIGIIGYVKGHWHTWVVYMVGALGLMGTGCIFYLLVAYPEIGRMLYVLFICLFGWIYYIPRGLCKCCCFLSSKISKSDTGSETPVKFSTSKADVEVGLIKPPASRTNRPLFH